MQAAATAHSRVRTLRAFPFPPSHASASVALTWVEDDGTTTDDPSAGGARDRVVISCELHCAPDALRLCARVTIHGDGQKWRPAFRTIDVCLPQAERRRLIVEQECWTNAEKSKDVVFEA